MYSRACKGFSGALVHLRLFRGPGPRLQTIALTLTLSLTLTLLPAGVAGRLRRRPQRPRRRRWQHRPRLPPTLRRRPRQQRLRPRSPLGGHGRGRRQQ